MRRQWFASLVLVTLGCAGAVDSDGPSEQELKLAAAKARNSGTATSDACAEHKWYGDGVCDTFCANGDSDCVPDGSGDAVVCAEFIEQANGTCSRPATDACRFQDPDCAGATTPGGGGGSDPSNPVACALISELPDGSCGRPTGDPCRFQDPDCNVADPSTGNPDCDTSKVTCQTFAPVVCPVGQVPTVVGSCYGPCVPKEECAGAGSGGSSGSGSGGAGSGTAGSGTAGSGTAGSGTAGSGTAGAGAGGSGSGGSAGSAGGTPSGGSSAGGSDPGTSGGSTGVGTVDCDVRKVTCQTLVEVVCPDGQVPSVVNACYGACVPKAECAPVACLTIIEVADGTCSRLRYDPCRGQDPDCTREDVVCAQFIEQPNGMCSRAPDDPCIFQDPDCTKQ